MSGLLLLCKVTTRVVLSAMQSGLCSAYISIDLAQEALLTLVSADSLLLVALEVQLHASGYRLLVPISRHSTTCLYVHHFVVVAHKNKHTFAYAHVAKQSSV
jgi:hypothetical protein